MRLPLDVAVRATGATLVDRNDAPPYVRVNTDTRSLERGDTFIALRGERFDGHEFAAEAAERGAAMLILDRPEMRVTETATMLVKDTRSAYMALAGAARASFEGPVIAITGSAGKTTTKEFLAQLLFTQYRDRVLTAPANENNEIGVSKLLLNASNEAYDVLVVEMGARHYGDIAALVEIARPHVGVLTNVGDAHVEIMGSRKRLEETKWALFSGGAKAVLNAADEVSRRRASELEGAAHWFAVDSSSPAFLPDEESSTLTTLLADRVVHRAQRHVAEYAVHFAVPGLHNRANAAAALAAALELNVPLEQMLDAITALKLPKGRYDRITLQGGIRLIYDAYNANASGMIAALDAFGAEAASRRIAVLGSMAELGEESSSLHERVGAHAAGCVDLLVVHGEYARELARGATRGGLDPARIVVAQTNAEAAAWLRDHVRASDVVLLKGSRKYKLEEIVEELRA